MPDAVTALISRKFLLCLIAVLLAALLCWFGKIADGVFSAVVIAVIGAYVAGNVTQKVASK